MSVKEALTPVELNKKSNKICKFCGKVFCDYKNNHRKYCSKKCYQQSRGDNREEKICLVCGKKFKVYPNRKDKAKYCSCKCYWRAMKDKMPSNINILIASPPWNKGKHTGLVPKSAYKKGDKHVYWQGGISFEPYSVGFNKKLKLKIRRRDNFTCQECGYTEKQLGYILNIHHIDYDKKNDKEKNLISLCNNCHSQTNFNRENWTNYFNGKM